MEYLIQVGIVVELTSMYDIENDAWSQGPNMVIPRWAHSCCILDDKLYAIGGLSSAGEYLSSIEAVNCDLWKNFGPNKVQW